MNYAIKISLDQINKTYPNPTVGCIITDKENNILSQGVTSTFGRPHAEENAINNLTKDKKNLSYKMFVTMEPCCYSSKKDKIPCLELIKNLNLKELYIGIPDPNPKIYGESIRKLRDLGIDVKIGISKSKILDINFGFLKKHLFGFPEISYKIATSLDGKIACKNGKSKWLTNEKSRIIVHKIRSEQDGILTTSNTVIIDNPELNVRNVNTEIQPRKIVIDRNLKLFNENKIEWKIFNKNQENTIVICENNVKKVNFLRKSFPNIFFFPLIDLSIRNIFLKITEYFGFSKILVEAGGKFLTSLMNENLIDKLYWFHGLKIIGNDGIPSVNNLNLLNLESDFNFKFKKLINLEGDSMRIFINQQNYNKVINHKIFKLK